MFILFCGSAYYPGGGMHDCSGVFPTLKEAQKGLYVDDWFHIVEIQRDGKLVVVQSSDENLEGKIFG